MATQTAAGTATTAAAAAGSKPKKSHEEIVAEFQQLRNQQRNLINNLSTIELDLKEHKTVIDTLKTVEGSRKCFRMIGGVLVEQTVGKVLPQLEGNREKLEKLIEDGKQQLTKKGIEINQYKDEHNINIRAQEPTVPAGSEKEDSEEKATPASGNRNVLVGNL